MFESKAEFSEFGFIEGVRKRFKSSDEGVFLGIGDDAAHLAVSPAGSLVTVDMLMEGVHFDLDYFEPEDLGVKSIAVNLSDIAAMGGQPKFILASLGIRPGLNSEFLNRLFYGFEVLTKAFGLSLVGGNLTKSPHSLVIDIVAMGAPVGKAFSRSGARAGDVVAVTGTLGAAAAGLHALRNLGRNAVKKHPALAWAQLRPQPRIYEGMRLAKWGGVTSAMDVSDGLASELGHVAKASQVGVLIEESKLPVLSATKTYASEQNQDLSKWMLHGGEDYELLFTFDRKAGCPPIDHREIGEVVSKECGLVLHTLSGGKRELEPLGWEHFKG